MGQRQKRSRAFTGERFGERSGRSRASVFGFLVVFRGIRLLSLMKSFCGHGRTHVRDSNSAVAQPIKRVVGSEGIVCGVVKFAPATTKLVRKNDLSKPVSEGAQMEVTSGLALCYCGPGLLLRG